MGRLFPPQLLVVGALAVVFFTLPHPLGDGIGNMPVARMSALSHAQEVWISALEWCESRGSPLAINKIDRDGTPSYGPWQFKPDTLILYIREFDVQAAVNDDNVMGAIMDWNVQNAVVRQMVLHSAEIDWQQQFPDCVKKLGSPPRK